MRAVVLGGTGFLGSNLLGRLCEDGHEVTATRHTSQLHRGVCDLPVDWVHVDLTDTAALGRVCESADVVYHVASPTNPHSAASDPQRDASVNISSALAIADVVIKNDARLVYLSSGGTVYGPAQGVDRIAEDALLAPISTYGVTKMAIEHYLRVAARQRGLDYRVARISNPYGPFQRIGAGQGAVGVFLRHALRGEPIELWGDGSVVRDYVYVSEVVDVLVRLATHSGDWRVFNIGSGVGTSLLALIEVIEEVVGRDVAVNFLGARNFDVGRNVLNIDRARAELEWVPQIGLADGISRYAQWMETE